MKSISTKLTGMMLAICLVGMGLLAVVSLVLFRGSLISHTLEQVSATTAMESERINGWLENQVSYVLALSIEYAYEEEYTKDNMLPKFNSHVDGSEQYFDVYMGYPDGIVMFASGMEPDYAGGWSSTKRPWYVGAMEDITTPHITAPYTDVQTGGLCITASKAVLKNGQVAGVASADILINELNDIVNQTDVGDKSYAFLVDRDGGILIHHNADYGPDADDVFQSMLEVEDGIYATVWEQTTQDGVSVIATNADGVKCYYTAQTIPVTGWKLYTAIPVSVIHGPVTKLFVVEAVVFVLVLAAAFALIYLLVKRTIVHPIADVTEAASALTQGSVDIQINRSYDDEIGELISSFTHMAQSIREQVELTDRIASGDLTSSVRLRSEADVMGKALTSLNESLRRFVVSVASAADRVTAGSQAISMNTQNMAQGAAEQSASVQGLSDAISDIAGQIKVTEEKTSATSIASGEIAQSAQTGSEQMERMIQAVQEINEASAGISKVIKVIDDIAFRTNILALNAAVEAAHAGQHGRGFAVVAGEVRSLAQKSATAAKETSQLLQESVARAAEGTRIAQETSESLKGIISGVGHTSGLVEEINLATKEQSAAIARINEGILQISQVVGQNASIAEDCASSAQDLLGEAAGLMEIVSQFSVGGNESPEITVEAGFSLPDVMHM